MNIIRKAKKHNYHLLSCYVFVSSSQGEFDWQRVGLSPPSRQLPLSPWQPRPAIHDDRWAVEYPLWRLYARHPHLCLYPRSLNEPHTPLPSPRVFYCSGPRPFFSHSRKVPYASLHNTGRFMCGAALCVLTTCHYKPIYVNLSRTLCWNHLCFLNGCFTLRKETFLRCLFVVNFASVGVSN